MVVPAHGFTTHTGSAIAHQSFTISIETTSLRSPAVTALPVHTTAMDSQLYKDLKVSRGFTYHYFYSPASSDHPTLLFIHGFPSSSFDWRRQVDCFRPKGYGLLVPDLLGAGGTSKPEDADAFRYALLARDVVDLLDAEGLNQVIGVSHDWGSATLSRLANLYPERFHAFAWLGATYYPPSPEPFNLDKVLAALKEKTGSPRYGYWKFFLKEGAHREIEQNIDSFLQLLYPRSPDLWVSMTDVGEAQKWIDEKRTPGIPQWLTQVEYDHIRAALLNGNVKSFLNYYRVTAESLSVQDNQKIPQEAWTIAQPTLCVMALQDAVTVSSIALPMIEKYIPHAKVERLDVGHWIQLEATEKLNNLLESWIKTLGLRTTK
ncbi:alpha/beta-hydrolase [Trametes elegans]|nr:alpha/beta-hydrolase [Trametes elegans]